MAKDEFDKIYAAALAVATDRKADFLMKGAALRRVQEVDGQALRSLFAHAGLRDRQAYYWIAIDRAFTGLGVPKDRLLRIGWTRLKELVESVSKDNVHELLAMAETYVVKDLLRVLAGDEEISGARSVNLRFSPEDYALLHATLLQHGAIQVGRGLEDKEAAIMEIVRKLIS